MPMRSCDAAGTQQAIAARMRSARRASESNMEEHMHLAGIKLMPDQYGDTLRQLFREHF